MEFQASKGTIAWYIKQAIVEAYKILKKECPPNGSLNTDAVCFLGGASWGDTRANLLSSDMVKLLDINEALLTGPFLSARPSENYLYMPVFDGRVHSCMLFQCRGLGFWRKLAFASPLEHRAIWLFLHSCTPLLLDYKTKIKSDSGTAMVLINHQEVPKVALYKRKLT